MIKPFLDFNFAKRHGVIVDKLTEKEAILLTYEPLKPLILQELRRYLKIPVVLKLIDKNTFQKKLATVYENQVEESHSIIATLAKNQNLQQAINALPPQELLEKNDHAPIIRLINSLIREAISLKASDIHLETSTENINIRFRVDGILQSILQIPQQWCAMLTSRIKIMAKLNIAEKRLPQDGRFEITFAGDPIDVRVAILPTHSGERIVLRLLHNKNYFTQLEHLGLSTESLQQLQQLIHKNHGILLITGPTGSGKTTTLYAALMALSKKKHNIMTVEDPIEYSLKGISQTQVNAKIGMDFARGLRAILRQDPDIVMVGEIRDEETARIAVQASLTGHLVFSSLHTNTTVGAITRLRDMGIASYLLSASLVGIVAQRLIRLICSHCEGKGCANCLHQGYQGRTGIYEIITIDDELRQLIHEEVAEKTLQTYCQQHFNSMEKHAYAYYEQGQTTLKEIKRVLHDESI